MLVDEDAEVVVAVEVAKKWNVAIKLSMGCLFSPKLENPIRNCCGETRLTLLKSPNSITFHPES